MTDIDTGTAIVLWVGLCIAVGLLANRYGRPWFSWTILSVLISPLLGFVFLLAVGKKTGAGRPAA